MSIEKLQKELVEKISLIPSEADSEGIGKEALEIVDKLRDHINDIITVGDRQLTALDYVIIADSRGGNSKLSERPRINNRTLKKLEDAIRDAGGKTSEELGQVEHRDEVGVSGLFGSTSARVLLPLALALSSLSDSAETRQRLEDALNEMRERVEQALTELGMEQASTNLENTGVESFEEQRQLNLN